MYGEQDYNMLINELPTRTLSNGYPKAWMGEAGLLYCPKFLVNIIGIQSQKGEKEIQSNRRQKDASYPHNSDLYHNY